MDEINTPVTRALIVASAITLTLIIAGCSQPDNHADDITALETRIAQLEADVEDIDERITSEEQKTKDMAAIARGIYQRAKSDADEAKAKANADADKELLDSLTRDREKRRLEAIERKLQ